jgi:P-type Cu2+ transporter
MMVVKKTLPVIGMSCAACAGSVESMIATLKGVEHASVSYAGGSVFVAFDPAQVTLIQMRESILAIGYDLLIEEDNDAQLYLLETLKLKERKIKLLVAVLFTLPVFILSMFFDHHNRLFHFICLFLSIPVLAFSGNEFFISAFKKIRHGLMNMDTLVALSTGIAWLFSAFNTIFPHFLHQSGIESFVYFESATVIITFILTGRYFEEKAKSKASSAIRKLMDLQPKELTVVRDGNELVIPAAFVKINDMVLVKPGENIPVDGAISNGTSYVDESSLTGESVPVIRQKGDTVFAGTLNQDSVLEIIAEKTGRETVLQKIIEMVQEAQSAKPPVQLLADKVSSVFVPVVLVIAAITFIAWFFISGNTSMAFVTTISVLVIACPCALGLATPTAIIAGIGRAAKQGIYIKNAVTLENAVRINVVVFDKTGTLTYGKISVEKSIWIDERKEYKEILYALEKNIHHPLATSIVELLRDEVSLQVKLDTTDNIPGKGVLAAINDKKYFAGNEKLLNDLKINLNDEISVINNKLSDEGHTVVFFGEGTQIIAVFGLKDTIRKNIPEVVKDLHKMGLEVWLLTGDHQKNAAILAEKAGIIHFRSSMLPAEKAIAIKEFQIQNKHVLMVGDGINDAAALAQADVSVAMPSGSDIAIESADVTLMKANLAHIPALIRLSTKSVRIIKQNLFWAFGYNVIAIPLAAGVLYSISGLLLNPMIASAAMALSSLSVVSNSLRLTRLKL